MITGTIKYIKNRGEGNFSFKDWGLLQELADKEKDIIESIRLFYPLKEINAEIRKVEIESFGEANKSFLVEIGLLESLGEQGFNYSFFYEDFPVLSELQEDIINYYLDTKEELENKILSGYEERHLKEINKLKKAKKI